MCDPLTTAERQQVQFVINSIDTEFHPRCAEVADELQHMLDNNDILAARGGLPDDAWGAYYSNDDEIGIDASGDDPDFDWDYLNYGFQVTVLHEGFHAGGILNHIQADIYAIECQGVFL